MTKNLRGHLFTLSILFLLIFSGIMYAQGKIIGKVTDKSNGEPLLGVNVVILGTHMGAATDENGEYIIVNVPVGTYSLQASMVGTNKVTQTNVVVSQNQTTRVDFQLEQTAIVGEEVVITAKRDILHKEVSSSQIVIDNKQLSEAAGVRTLQDFISTQAGITGTDYLNIREGRPSETGTVINGLTFVNARVGKTESLIPTSAVEQVSLKAGGMSAEYGDFRSGVINVATKYGTSDGYHGTFSFTRSPAHLKRFGPSLYDPMNNYLRPHLDPEIAFIGVTEAVKRGIIDNYQKQQFTQYPSFAGWIQINNKSLPAAWKNKGITPVDLYLYDAWMHMVMPDFEKLNKVIRDLNAEGLNVGNEVTDQNLMSLFARHANKEAKYGDYNFDGGFGGPIPLIGKALGNATFYLSNVTKRQTYIQPLELDFDFSSSTMLALKSNITNSITLKITGVYTYQKGMNPARGADSEIPNLATANDLGSSVYQGLDRGALMPENNIPLFVAYGSNYGPIYYWYPTMLQPWIQKNYLVGANLTHAISSKTFYDFTISYQSTKEDINATQTRDLSVVTHLGPIPVTEMPYGRRILNVGQSQDTIDGFIFDQYYSVPGLAERFDSKGGCFYDNSLTRQLRMKFNFGSQITKMHFIKAGLEFNYINLKNDRWSYWPNQGPLSMYEYNFKVEPRTFGAYLQDEITFEDMVANIGIRMDYYGFGDLKWPTGDPWNADAFAAPTWTPQNYLEILRSGRSIIWERWNEVNNKLIAEGKKPLFEPVDDHLVFSPRFGIAFPITERAKFYFNYGHFRSLPPFSELFMYDFRYDDKKGGLYQLGNPNLEPTKTVQYELGVDYNLFDQYLIHIAGYYKDVTGEVRVLTYTPTTAGIPTYRFRTNDRYRTIQGLELQITKSVGEYLTGWLNMQYTYASGGNTGRNAVFQDPSSNEAPSAFSYANPSRPDPVPEIKANINLRSPSKWGYLLGDWNLSILPHWRLGNIFRYNPRNVEGVNNEFRWPNFWMVNLRLSKTFNIGFIKATAYLDVNNLFNNKIFMYNYAFYGGNGSASGSDFQAYMASLHLKEYADPYWDPIRDETKGDYLYPGYVYTKDVVDQWGIEHKKGEVVQEDHIGDMRSKDKPWINDPNVDIFTYGYARSIWFGIRFDF